jgi:hypothetical protein
VDSGGVNKNKINNVKQDFNITDGWISGFIQSDGCFTMAFEKRDTGLFIRPRPIFSLAQDFSEEKLFKRLHEYLGKGYVHKSNTDVYLEIRSLSALKDVIFPILDKHPLKHGKLKAYLIFKNIVEEMLNKNHLKLDGLLRIIYASFQLNVETSRRTEVSKNDLLKFLEAKYGKLPTPEELGSNLIPSTSLLLPWSKSPLSLEFLAGLIDGDGSFNVSFQIKPYRRVRVNFTVVQESSCKELLYELKSYFSCGSVYDLPSAAYREGKSIYKLEDVNLILNNLVPLLNKVKFNTNKGQDYKIMVKVCEILKDCKSLTNETFIKIIELAYKKNKLSKNRTIPIEELIQKVQMQRSSKAPKLDVIQKRGITTCSLHKTKLNPNFVTGFVDGEGSFFVGMSKDNKRSGG